MFTIIFIFVIASQVQVCVYNQSLSDEFEMIEILGTLLMFTIYACDLVSNHILSVEIFVIEEIFK